MAYTYRALFKERIEVARIVHGSPEAVARWFEARWKPQKWQEFNKWSFETSESNMLEYLAARRIEPLIDHAIARWGYSLASIRRVFARGDASTRTAALANPRGVALLPQAADVVKAGHLVELNALLQNPYIDGSFLDDAIGRKGKFDGLPDDRLLRVIWCLTGSERLSKRYEGRDYMVSRQFDSPGFAAWALALTIPVDLGWASSLEALLAKCPGGLMSDKAPEALERWRIDPPAKVGAAWFDRPPSFLLRVLLAKSLPAENDLLESDDLALRVSFYRRFEPEGWHEWPKFLNRDGSDFIAAAIENENLWRSEALRDALRQVCGQYPDPSTYHATMQGDFWTRERVHREKHPDWFADEDASRQAEPDVAEASVSDVLAVQRLMLEGMEATRIRLEAIEAAIRAIPAPRRGLF